MEKMSILVLDAYYVMDKMMKYKQTKNLHKVMSDKSLKLMRNDIC